MSRQLMNLLWGALTGALGGLIGGLLVQAVGLIWALVIAVGIAVVGLALLPPLMARLLSPEVAIEVRGLAASAFFFGIPGVLIANWFGIPTAVIAGVILGMLPVLLSIAFLRRQAAKSDDRSP